LAIACDVVQARIIHSYIVDYFRRVPALKKLVLKDTQEGLLLKNGIDIIISTNNYKSTRGRPVLAAILDECAFYPDRS
jgi:hypothetical protein